MSNNNNKEDILESTADNVKGETKETNVMHEMFNNSRSNQSSSLNESELRTTSSNTVTISFSESDSTSSSSNRGDPNDGDDSDETDSTSSDDDEEEDESAQSNQIADFSGQGFTTVPSIIFHRITITKLNLSNNNLNYLPSEICDMINLQYLDISHNNLQGSTEVLGMNSIDGIQMKNTNESIHRSNKSVDFLNNNNHDHANGKLDHVQLPKDMNRLINLKTLKLSSCDLKFIPKIVFQIISLTKLDISENWTNEIPTAIGNLLELRCLLAKRMGLSTLPIQIINCSKLRTINLYGNEITSLPDEFSRLYKLKALHLDYRHFIKALIKPRKVSKVKMVNFIDSTDEAGDNNITIEVNKPRKSIVAEETAISIAERLDTLLRSGQMKSYHIPAAIFKLRRLTALHLDRCQLNFIPENLTLLKRLRELYLSKNYFREIPQGLFTLHNTLEYLDLSDNKLDDEEDKSVLLPKDFGAKFQMLKVLKLSSMNLTCLQNGVLCGMIGLELLDLSRNKISQLPDDINSLISLEELFLSENKLTSLPNTICQLKELRTLDVSYNQLSGLPGDLYLLKNIQTSHLYKGLNKSGLWLQGNPLTSIPQSVWKTIDTKHLWKYLEDQKLKKLSSTKPTKIFIIGDKFSGKSTLIKYLMKEGSINTSTQISLPSQLEHFSIDYKSMIQNIPNNVELPLEWSPILINHCSSPNGFKVIFYEITLPQLCDLDHSHSSLCNQHSGLELILPHLLDSNSFYILLFNTNLLIENFQQTVNSICFHLLKLIIYAPGSIIKLVGTHCDQIDPYKSFLQDSINANEIIDEQNHSLETNKSENPLITIKNNESDNNIRSTKSGVFNALQKHIINTIERLSKCTESFNLPNLYKHEANNKITVLQNISFVNLSLPLSKHPITSSPKNKVHVANQPYLIDIINVDELWSEIEHRINYTCQTSNRDCFIPKSWYSLIVYVRDKLKPYFMVKLDLRSEQNNEDCSSSKIGNNQLTLDKTFFDEMKIDNIEDCLNYYHSIGQFLYFPKHKYLKDYLILHPTVFLTIINGIINPQIITSAYYDMSNSNKSLYLRWYLSAISGYSNESLKEYFSSWDHHKSIPYQLIRCLLPPFGYRTCKSIPSNKPHQQIIQQRRLLPSKQNHHLDVPSHHQVSRFAMRSSVKSKSPINLSKQVETEKDYFNLSVSSVSEPKLSLNSVLLLTDLLEAGFKIHNLILVNEHLKNVQLNNPKPYIIYPCIFSDNNSMEFLYSNTTNCIDLTTQYKIKENECIREIWFPLGRPMGYFNRLSVSLCKVICDQTKYIEFCGSIPDLKYTEKFILNDSMVKHNTFIVAYDHIKIILEEVTVNGSLFSLSECDILYGIRCIQQTKQKSIPNDNVQPNDIAFNPFQWFTETCNKLNNEAQGIVWFWSK
ncbi:unnamed protein product [Schistosoma rodhaini]|uniref:Disease resistance R13L4/SHOC-2-like LRR domain-containing protein n=1 Tax=Schistosoma rodhaini TaxID=6188 RepID=A0AA85G0S7_9TREM|nr:unnamed protein product [Schistosoma rodhaini]CAH8597202.1 unnamed protein product [Schistosoma rodhaini]